MAREGELDELDSVGWVIRLTKTLEQLHARGEVHGAVSPRCVRTDGAERRAHGVLVPAAALPADAAFRSPERINGGKPSAVDDTWAAAATLQALLTGAAPFSASNEAELHQKVLAGS